MSDAGSTNPNDEDNGGATNDEVDDSTLNQAFNLLAGHRHRYVLEKLRETSDGVATVNDLADHLVKQVPDATDRDQETVALHHNILPKLDDANIIDFDPRTDTARYRGTELIEDLLDFIATRTE